VHYITRTGLYSPSAAEARIKHQGLEAGTEHVREDLVYWRARNLPTWSHDNPVTYFSAAEQHERANGAAYTEWRFSLPRELSHTQQMAAARDLLLASFGDRHPYVWALHDPIAADGGRQPHVHCLWSGRTLDGIERGPAQFFKRYNAQHPERGGAQKSPALNHFGAVKAARILYTDTMNLALERGGYEARVHPDSLESRGIDYRTPEPRLQPSDSNALKYKYEVTERMQEVMVHRMQRTSHAEQEQAQAQRYWEGRKVTLGITRHMTHEQKLERITYARERLVHEPERPRVSVQALTREAQRLEHSIGELERYHTRVGSERRSEQRAERTGRQRSQAEILRTEHVLAEGKTVGLPRDHEAERFAAQAPARSQGLERFSRALDRLSHDESPQHGATLRVRIWDREREVARGDDFDRGFGF
jgi:hypothetical protein